MAEASSKKTSRAPKVTIVSNNPPKQEAKPQAAASAKNAQSASAAPKKKAAQAPAPSVRVDASQGDAARAEAASSAPKPKVQLGSQVPQAQQEGKAEPQPKAQPDPQGAQSEPQPVYEEATGVQPASQTTTQKMGAVQQGIKDKINGMAHPHAFYFGVLGLVLALLIFWIGFFRTLLIVLLVVVGVAIGQWYDGDPKIINAVKKAISSLTPRDDDERLS